MYAGGTTFFGTIHQEYTSPPLPELDIDAESEEENKKSTLDPNSGDAVESTDGTFGTKSGLGSTGTKSGLGSMGTKCTHHKWKTAHSSHV